MRRSPLMAACLLVLAFITPAQATSITYTETVLGSGSLGGTPFTDALITIRATADTADVVSGGGGFFQVNNALAEFAVAGDGSGTFPSLSFGETFVQQSSQAVGIRVGTTGFFLADILDVENPAFGTYDLKSPIGPVSGTPTTNSTDTFVTSAGNFIITSTTGDATFEAISIGTAVPEPSTLVLAAIGGLGLVGVVLVRRRQRS